MRKIVCTTHGKHVCLLIFTFRVHYSCLGLNCWSFMVGVWVGWLIIFGELLAFCLFACDWVTFACRDVETVNASDQTSHHPVSGSPGLSLGARSLCLVHTASLWTNHTTRFSIMRLLTVCYTNHPKSIPTQNVSKTIAKQSMLVTSRRLPVK